MSVSNAAYRATVFAPRGVDSTEQTYLTPSAAIVGGAAIHYDPFRVTTNDQNWNMVPDASMENPGAVPSFVHVCCTGTVTVAKDAAQAFDGAQSLKVVLTGTTGSTNGIYFTAPPVAPSVNLNGWNYAAIPGQWYTWSYYVYATGGAIGSIWSAGIEWHDAAGNWVGSDEPATVSGAVTTLVAGWQRLTCSFKAPPGAVGFSVNCYTGAAFNGTVWMDAFQLEQSPYATPFNANFRPFMGMPGGRRGRIDLLSKKTDTGELGFDILDVRTTPGGSNASRWFTAFVGDARGLPLLARLRVFIEESLDGGVTWAPFFTGRVKLAALRSGSRVVAQLAVRDMSDDMTWTLFPGMPHAAVQARDVPSSSGTATSAASTTLTDTGQAWSTNQFAGLYVRATDGTGAGQVRMIVSNTATQLTVATAWAITPDATTVYAVGGYAQMVSLMPVGFVYRYGTAKRTAPLKGQVSFLDATNGWALVSLNGDQRNLPENQWTASLQASMQNTPWGSPVYVPPATTPSFVTPPTFTGHAVARVRRLDTNAEGDFLIGYGYVQTTQQNYGGFLPPTTVNCWGLVLKALSYPLGIATGTPLANGAQAASPTSISQSVNTKGWTATVTGIMAAGDIVSFAGDNQRYQVTAAVNSDGSGNAALVLMPGLQVAVTDGQAVTVQRSPSRMALPPLSTAVQLHVVADMPIADGGSTSPVYDAKGIQIGTVPKPGNLLLINDVHPAQLLADVLAGYYGMIYRPHYDLISGAPYVALPAGKNLGDPMWSFGTSASAFASLIADQTFPTFRCVIDKSMPMRDFIEKYICQPYGIGYYFDASGNFVPVDLREKTSLAGLVTITDADLVDDVVPTWQYDPGQAVTNAKITVYGEAIIQPIAYRLQQGDQFPTITSKMFDAQAGQIIDLSLGNLDLGQTALTLDMKGYRAMPNEAGYWYDFSGTGHNGSRYQAITQAALRMAYSIASHPYGNGPTLVGLTCVRNANTANVWPGTWFMYQISSMPTMDTNTRGSTRLAICLERREDGPQVAINGVDWGVAVVSNPPSAMGVPALFTGDGQHSTSETVTMNAQNEPVEAWLSIQPPGTSTGASIADSDPSWVYLGYGTGVGTLTFVARGLPAGCVVFWRARTFPRRMLMYTGLVSAALLKMPSAWVHASAGVALTGLSAVTSLTASGLTANGATLAWVNPDATHFIQVLVKQGAGPYVLVATLPPGSTGYKFSQLAQNTAYTASVRPIDGVGGFAETTVGFSTNFTPPIIITPYPPRLGGISRVLT